MAIPFTLTPENGRMPSSATLESEAKKYGIQFSIDGEKGTFSGRGVSGTFSLMNDCIHINVIDKPRWLLEAVIKVAITKWFDSLPK
jgi:hypothetical protein